MYCPTLQKNDKEPKDRRGKSFEKDNSNQANKGKAKGAKAPRELEDSKNKGDVRSDVKGDVKSDEKGDE